MQTQFNPCNEPDGAFKDRGRRAAVIPFVLDLRRLALGNRPSSGQPGKGKTMEALAYFIIWAIIIFLAMRFGCGAHVAGPGNHDQRGSRGHGRKIPSDLRWIPPDTDTDPVCGKQVNTDQARSSVYDGHVYYFCSRDCREVFEASPQQHLGPHARQPGTGLEERHV